MNDPQTENQIALVDDDLLTRAEVCDRLKITKRTLFELERKGVAPPMIKIGGSARFPKSLFDKFLRDRVRACDSNPTDACT